MHRRLTDIAHLPQRSTQITLEPPVGRDCPEPREPDTLADGVQVRCCSLPASPAATNSLPQSTIKYPSWGLETLDFLRPGGNPQAIVVEGSAERTSQGISVGKCPGFSLSDRYDGNAVRVGQSLLFPDQPNCRRYALLPRSAGIAVRVGMDEQDVEGSNVLTCSFENSGCPATVSIGFGGIEFSHVPDLDYVIGAKQAQILYRAVQNAAE